MTLSVMVIGIFIPYSWVGHTIGLTPLPSSYFLWLIPTLLCYCATVQIVKLWFIRKFQSWL